MKIDLPARTVAKKLGQMHYFTGDQCIRGHISKRNTATGQCLECAAEYRKKPSYMEKRRVKMAEWQRQEPRKKKAAREKVKMAIKSNVIQKQPCEKCGATEIIHAHHEDYDKPLDVMWLCHKHHRDRHKELKEMENAS